MSMKAVIRMVHIYIVVGMMAMMMSMITTVMIMMRMDMIMLARGSTSNLNVMILEQSWMIHLQALKSYWHRPVIQTINMMKLRKVKLQRHLKVQVMMLV